QLLFEKQELSSSSNPNAETFDFIISEHKSNILRLLTRLQDKKWFHDHGERRKEGFMLAGSPGCGKTKFAIAAALFLKRHLIIVDCKRIKNIQQMESIVNLSSIQDVELRHDNVIFLFEEFSMSTFSDNDKSQ